MIEVVAMAEIRKDRLEQMKAQYGYRGYLDYNKMLENEELDIVCVLVPVSYHRKVVEDVAKHKIHIFCEKPLCTTMEDALAMKKAVMEAGIKFYYGLSYRTLIPCMKAKELIDEGKIGKIRLMTESYFTGQGYENYEGMSFHHYPKGGIGGHGFGLVDHGIHFIDLFSWFCSSEISSVLGQGCISGESPVTEYMIMNFENGAMGHILYELATVPSDLQYEGVYGFGAVWDSNANLILEGSWHNYPINIRIQGETGALRIYPYDNILVYFGMDGKEYPIPLDNKPSPFHFGTQIERFAQNIINDEQPECSIDKGIKNLQVLFAAYKSAEERRFIDIEDLE